MDFNNHATKHVYPLGLYNINERPNSLDFKLITEEEVNDNKNSMDSFDYIIPNFKYLSFEILSEKKKTITADNLNDKILKIIVTVFDNKNNTIKENFLVSKEDESETLLE